MKTSPDIPVDLRTTSLLTRCAMLTLCLYWIALFYGTHYKIPSGMLPGNSDKVIHFFAYAGLGMLWAILRATQGAITWGNLSGKWLMLAAYGVFDELTQLLVNRNADLKDLLFDVSGAATGLIIVAFAVWGFQSKIWKRF